MEICKIKTNIFRPVFWLISQFGKYQIITITTTKKKYLDRETTAYRFSLYITIPVCTIQETWRKKETENMCRSFVILYFNCVVAMNRTTLNDINKLRTFCRWALTWVKELQHQQQTQQRITLQTIKQHWSFQNSAIMLFL